LSRTQEKSRGEEKPAARPAAKETEHRRAAERKISSHREVNQTGECKPQNQIAHEHLKDKGNNTDSSINDQQDYNESVEVTVPLPHLIETKNYFLTHFYTMNVKIKMGSGKEPYPYRILYIGLSKRLNDYYAPMT
jgi:hypothetical protein